MIKFILCTLLLLEFYSFAGQEVGNGGDTVLCRPSPSNPFVGLYSLDYLLTYQISNQNQDIVKVASVDDSIKRIRTLIAKKLPELLSSFDEFFYSIGNKNYFHNRIWEEASFGLVDIKDEQIIALLPENCKNGNSNQLIQTIIRLNPLISGYDERIFYKYVPNLIEKMKKENPLQLSYLYLHEWLWEISHNVENNRRLNRFFHSTSFEVFSRNQILTQLAASGIKMPKVIVPRIFNNYICQADPEAARKLLAFVQGKNNIIFKNKMTLFTKRSGCALENNLGCVLGDIFSYQYSANYDSIENQLMAFDSTSGKNIFRFSYTNKNKYGRIAFDCSLEPATAIFSCSKIVSYGAYSAYSELADNNGPMGSIGKNGCIQFYKKLILISSNRDEREFVLWVKYSL